MTSLDEAKPALMRAGVGARYWRSSLNDHGPVGKKLTEWVISSGSSDISQGRGITLLGDTATSVRVLHLLGKALLWGGITCRVVDVSDLLKNEADDYREPMDSVACLLIQRFYDDSYAEMVDDKERREIERLVMDRINNGLSVCIQVDKPEKAWPWSRKVRGLLAEQNQVMCIDDR